MNRKSQPVCQAKGTYEQNGMTEQNNTYTVRLIDGTTVGPIDLSSVKELLLRGELCEEDRSRLVKELFAPFENDHLTRQSLGDTLSESGRLTFNSMDILQGIPPALVFIAGNEESADAIPNAAEMGQLEHIPVPRLLYYFHSRQMSGRLQLLIDGQRPWEIYFNRGTIEQIVLPPEQDDLADRLLSQSLCSSEQIREAALRCERDGGQLSDHLIMLQFVNPHELVHSLHEQFCAQLVSCFSFREGRYLFYSNERPKTATVPYSIDLFPLIQKGIVETYSDSDIRWILEPFYNCTVGKAENPFIVIDALRLSPRQTRMLHMIDQVNTLWELIERAQKLNVSEELPTHYFVFFLSQLELLLFDNHTLGPRIQDNVNLLESSYSDDVG